MLWWGCMWWIHIGRRVLAHYDAMRQTMAFRAWPKAVNPGTGVFSVALTLFLTASSIRRRYIMEQDMYQDIWQYFSKMPQLLAVVVHCLAFFNINIVGLWISLPCQKLHSKIWTNTKIQEECCAIADFLGQTSSSTCCHDPRYSSSFQFATLQEKMQSHMPWKSGNERGSHMKWIEEENKRWFI